MLKNLFWFGERKPPVDHIHRRRNAELHKARIELFELELELESLQSRIAMRKARIARLSSPTDEL